MQAHKKNYLMKETILITGATGSFGKKFVQHLIKYRHKYRKIIIFSRDELKQYELKNSLKKVKNLRFFIGDIRDFERLNYAFKEVDTVIHAAALKQVDTAEYNPFEFIKTNIIGSENVVKAALNNNVKKVLALSTDKASSPINLYGATKLCADKLFTSANLFKGNKNIKFSVVRYGNVFGSRGSIAHVLKKQNMTQDYFEITDKNMTRFNISLEESVNLVNFALKKMLGGEIFVPNLKSYNLLDLVKVVNDKKKITFTGIRPGEKIHEEMISKDDMIHTFDLKQYYVCINPIISKTYNYYKKRYKKVDKNFVLNSSNVTKLSKKELKKIMNKFYLL